MIALVACDDGVYVVDVEEDRLAERLPGETLEPRPRPGELVPSFALSHLVDCDAAGSAVVLLLDRRPPLLVSHDGGETWSERGGGLPSGRGIALGENPDHVLYGARNRLYVSTNGGVFWRALTVEVPEIRAVAWG